MRLDSVLLGQTWLLVKGDSIGRLDSTKRCLATSGAIAESCPASQILSRAR
jgi:hypothetical protein